MPAPLLTVDDVLFLHAFAVAEFGGVPAVGDHAALGVALARPTARFGDDLYYPDPFQRAAAVAHSLLVHEPFQAGNVRTAAYVMAAWLEREGFRLRSARGQLRAVMAAAAGGQMTVRDLAAWLEASALPLTAA